MADGADIPDHELTRVLREHDLLLEQQAWALLTTGAASFSVAGLLLHARLRRPRRWRKGLLEVTSEDPSTGATVGTASPLRRTCGPREIKIRLATEVVHRPGQPG
jgi:hypothetical protein